MPCVSDWNQAFQRRVTIVVAAARKHHLSSTSVLQIGCGFRELRHVVTPGTGDEPPTPTLASKRITLEPYAGVVTLTPTPIDWDKEAITKALEDSGPDKVTAFHQMIASWLEPTGFLSSGEPLDQDFAKVLEHFGPEKVSAFQSLVEEWLELNRDVAPDDEFLT